MGLRDQLSQHAALVTMGAALVIGGAVYVAVRGVNTPSVYVPGAAQLWYAPEGGGEVVALADQLPPVQHGGQTYVRAYVFACGSCGDYAARFTAYLERFDPAIRADLSRAGITRYTGPRSLDQFSESELAEMLKGKARQVRRPKDEVWLDSDDPKAQTLRKEVEKRCPPDKPLTPCLGPPTP